MAMPTVKTATRYYLLWNIRTGDLHSVTTSLKVAYNSGCDVEEVSRERYLEVISKKGDQNVKVTKKLHVFGHRDRHEACRELQER